MEPGDLKAMVQGPRNSHSSDGQKLVTITLEKLRAVLEVPDELEIFIVPGSIRQTLADLTAGLVQSGTRCLALQSGYWGEFIADLAEHQGGTVTRVEDVRETTGAFDLVTAVHMETETGLMQALDALAAHRADGATTLIDAACTVPYHPLDWDLADIVVLGSHKCLGGAPGLGIVVMRTSVKLESPWPLTAYRADAISRRTDNKRPTPLVTYPTELLSALNSSLTRALADSKHRDKRVNGAKRLRAALLEHRFDVNISENAAVTVTRVDLPDDLDAEALRRELARHGFFVIGNVGSSSGGSIRIGTMSDPQVDPRNIDALVEAMTQSRSSVLGGNEQNSNRFFSERVDSL